MLTEGTIFGERVIFCDGGFRVLGRRSKKSGSGGKRESPPTGGAQKKKKTPVRSPLFMLFRSPNMKAAIQLFTWCHVMFVDNKMAVPSSCSVDEAV